MAEHNGMHSRSWCRMHLMHASQEILMKLDSNACNLRLCDVNIDAREVGYKWRSNYLSGPEVLKLFRSLADWRSATGM